MSTIITGVVTNGVIVPNSLLPEGAQVEIQVKPTPAAAMRLDTARLSPTALRKMPRVERQAVLAAAAELAESDYRDDKELTGFDAFSEENVDDDDSRTR